MRMAKFCAAMASPLFALAAAACSQSSTTDDGGWSSDEPQEARAPTESEVRALLEAHFKRNGACTPFFQMPRDLPVDSTYEQQRMDAFAAAGLVRREGELTLADPNTGSGTRRVVRYALTPEGATYIRPGSDAMADYRTVICYGRYAVDSVKVGSVSEGVADANITYRYRLVDPAPWLSAPAIQAKYANFASWRADRQAEDQNETLTLRDGKWELDPKAHPDLYDLRQLSR